MAQSTSDLIAQALAGAEGASTTSAQVTVSTGESLKTKAQSGLIA